jgi:hypothetical protein
MAWFGTPSHRWTASSSWSRESEACHDRRYGPLQRRVRTLRRIPHLRSPPALAGIQNFVTDAPALIVAIINAVPRDAPGTSVLFQIIAVVRARRRRDRTNADRQRRFRQRRREPARNGNTLVSAITSSTEGTG